MSGQAGQLAQQVWGGGLRDDAAPELALLQALSGGASYGDVLGALREIARMGLPGIRAAEAARARWPGSIDLAVLACDLRRPRALPADLDHLRGCVLKQNRRRAALAGACLRAGDVNAAQAALAQIDPASNTAADDLWRRADLALSLADFCGAEAAIDALRAQGWRDASAALRLRLIHQRDGAQAFAELLEGAGDEPAFWAQAFDLAIAESDFDLAPDCLARWQACPDAAPAAVDRACTRLALERGDAQAALAQLQVRLDLAQPWGWAAVDHVQWLRAGQMLQRDPPTLLAHARAACRLFARHDWLHHMAQSLRELSEDWGALAQSPPLPGDTPQRALIASHAALRLGLTGRAACALARARHGASGGEALRLHLQRAEVLWLAGRLAASRKALGQASACARTAPERAEIAILGAEIALTEADGATAETALRPAVATFPRRMSVILTEARIAFAKGDFAQAMKAHARFNAMKLAQSGTIPPPDVRDLIVEDAFTAAQGQGGAFAPDQPVAAIIAAFGADRIATSPGLSACLLARARGALEFRPSPASIPRQIVHYWEGPPGPALTRARAQWARLHPGFTQRMFDDTKAADWLHNIYGAQMAERFARFTQPAVRADLFRAAWLASEGGVFTDLDEYPRTPVTGWLDDAQVVLCIERGFGTVANNFLSATPGHPLCRLALDHICDQLDHCDTPYAWWHSGPAQWTRAAFAQYFIEGRRDVRFLSQAQYCRQVATNLPYPHKRSPEHWR